MELLNNALGNAASILKTMEISDILDILIVAYLIYKAIWFIRRNNTHNIANGIIVLLVVLGLSELFSLTMINYLLRKTVELGLIALVILFQPELRRLLERMGSFAPNRGFSGTALSKTIEQMVLACEGMSESKTGALIVLERSVRLNDVMSTGTIVNSDVTAELLKNLFFKNAPLHDGAVVIRDNRICSAGCVLPLTKKTNLSKELGTRHRAGIGMSEQSDAVVIIVSEETGAISVAIEGMLKRHLSSASLDKLLRNELIKEDDGADKDNFFGKLKKRVAGIWNGKEQSDK